MWTQGVDPELDFHDINKIKGVYERATKMVVPPRHPYAGELVFTAFSGSHQDAINKGKMYMDEHGGDYWDIPYLPIDPADVGREYEPIIRINSQSGKGGMAFILANDYGIKMPKAMQSEFSAVVQRLAMKAAKKFSLTKYLISSKRNTEMFAVLTSFLIIKLPKKRTKRIILQLFISPANLSIRIMSLLKFQATAQALSAHSVRL